MSLFDDLLFPLAAGAVAGIVAITVGATAATATAIGALTAAGTAVLDDKLWEKINKKLCTFRDKIIQWLQKHETKAFGVKISVATVLIADSVRKQVNRILRAETYGFEMEREIIEERILTKEEIEEMGIGENSYEYVPIENFK